MNFTPEFTAFEFSFVAREISDTTGERCIAIDTTSINPYHMETPLQTPFMSVFR